MEEGVKLTKGILNKFITWSSSRYNNYLGYGTKKENIDTIYNSLMNGCYTNYRGKQDTTKKVFTIECAVGVGEGGNGRYWKVKGVKDYQWTINCETLTIEGFCSKEIIKFIQPTKDLKYVLR